MNNLKYLIPAVLLLMVSCNISSTSEEQPESVSKQTHIELNHHIQSDDGLFEISFPSEPQIFSEIVESDLGNLETHFYYCEFSESMSFILSYTDYPQEYINKYDANELLFTSMNGVADNTGADIIEHQTLMLNDCHAIDYETTSTMIRSWHRSVLVNNRLYQIGVHNTAVDIQQNIVVDYFNSFRF